MANIFFFEIKKIRNSATIFDELKRREIFFSYFKVDQRYYLLVFQEQAFDPDFLYQSLNQVKELNSKKRALRSFRGFLLYVLEIINQGKFSKVLQTNLNSYFWLKLPSVIRQNRKEVFLQFLFPPAVPNNGEDRPSNI